MKKLETVLYTILTTAAVLLVFWLFGTSDSAAPIPPEDLLSSLPCSETTRYGNEISFLLDSFPCRIDLEGGQTSALLCIAEDPLKDYKSYTVITDEQFRSDERAQAFIKGGIDEGIVCRLLYGDLTLTEYTRDDILKQRSDAFSSALGQLTEGLCDCGLLRSDECAQYMPEWLNCYRSMENWERQLARCAVSIRCDGDCLCFSFSEFR